MDIACYINGFEGFVAHQLSDFQELRRSYHQLVMNQVADSRESFHDFLYLTAFCVLAFDTFHRVQYPASLSARITYTDTSFGTHKKYAGTCLRKLYTKVGEVRRINIGTLACLHVWSLIIVSISLALGFDSDHVLYTQFFTPVHEAGGTSAQADE